MKYLVSGFLDVINEILIDIMSIFTGPFWENLGISVKKSGMSISVGGKFDEWLPGVQYLRESFVWIGMFFVILLLFIGLLKVFLPEGMSESAEHPLSVIARAIGAAFAVLWAYQIMYVLQAPMAGIFDGIYQLSSLNPDTTHLNNGFASDAVGEAGFIDYGGSGFVHELDLDSSGGNAVMDTLGGTAILIIMSFAVMWMYIKLVLEMVERYVTTCFLFYVSPLAFSAAASKSTQGIASNFIRMLFAQYLLIMFNCIFLFVFCYAFSHMGDHKFTSISEVIIYFAAMMAWLKLGQRLDEHMNTLGLGAARTGAGLGGELVAAAGMAWGGFKLAGSAVRNGAGLGKGVATGKASDKTAGGRIGNTVHKGAAAAASTAAGRAAMTKAADAGLQGLKTEANGALSSRSIADAAMGIRATTGVAAVAAANQGLTLSGGGGADFDSAVLGGGHITGTADGEQFDFVPREGKAVSGPYLSATGPDGKEWIASLSDENGNVKYSALDTDFARDAMGRHGMVDYLNGKWGGAGFGSEKMTGLYYGYDRDQNPVAYADATLFAKDSNFTDTEKINGRDMLKAYGHYDPSFRK